MRLNSVNFIPLTDCKQLFLPRWWRFLRFSVVAAMNDMSLGVDLEWGDIAFSDSYDSFGRSGEVGAIAAVGSNGKC